MSFFFPKPVTWDVEVRRLESINKQLLVTNGKSLTEGSRPQGTPQTDCLCNYIPKLWNLFQTARDLLQEIYIFKKKIIYWML